MIFRHFQKYQDMHFKKFPQKEGLVQRWEEYNKKQKEKAKVASEVKAAKEEEESKVEEIHDEPVQPENVEKKRMTPQEKAQYMTEAIQQEYRQQFEAEAPKKQIPKEMSDISTYNGDTTEKYKWSQELNEVIVQIDLPPKSNSKSVKVQMDIKHLKVVNLVTKEEIINGELFGKISTDDSFWNIEDGNKLILTLTKSSEIIWKTIIVGDKEIDPKKVDNSKRLDQFDEETQGHLHKVLYEQNRKLNGLPTTEEMEQQKLMEKVFNAENSPFKQNPYDPPKQTNDGAQIPFKF